MNQQQSFKLSPEALAGFSSVFMKLVFMIIAVYLLVMVINFLRDKFINQEVSSKKEDISDLLTILHKLFFFAGYGFIIANIMQYFFSKLPHRSGGMVNMNLRGEWDYLAFGVIIIFIGLGFKAANRILKK
ncbi:hypothetical protein [Sunxiuqinia sp. sy24]|uniref:hypothetical protein n=1 Tax=Sunxiuqinia sp. sy24 TaxID=3461495 RepID=UPI0040465BF6